MNKKQLSLILGLAVAALIVPDFTAGLCFLCAATGAFLYAFLS